MCWLCHLVLVVEESVDTCSGAGVPDLHTFVRWAEGSRAEQTFDMFYSSSWVCLGTVNWNVSLAWHEWELGNADRQKWVKISLYGFMWTVLCHSKLSQCHSIRLQRDFRFALPWYKVGVIWGEGDIKNPGSMSTQCTSQVGVLPVKQEFFLWTFCFILLCTHKMFYLI